MDIEDKINLILKWADRKNFVSFKKFDTSFVESVKNWIQEHDPSQNQIDAIDNIITKFKILKS
jgi:hypothetical protein